MAKEKPGDASKSENVTGGSKAADFAPGGRANPSGPPENADRSGNPIEGHAPVTTDAVANTPPVGEAGAAPRNTVPARDEANVPAAARGNTLTPNSPRASGLEPFDPSAETANRPKRAGVPKGMGRFVADAEDAPDLTVRDFVGMVKEFTAAARARNWFVMFQTGGAIAAAFAQLVNGGGLFGTTQEDANALAGADNLAVELAQARAELGNTVGARAFLSFDGGNEPHPLSGSPMPLAAAQASGPDPKSFDPSMALVLFELVMKAFQAFRNRK